MLRSEGHLFHIDFGFILGADPKIFPPPFKLTYQMVEAMGGEASEEYEQFKVLLLPLRKHTWGAHQRQL